jgi:hypothetical protein
MGAIRRDRLGSVLSLVLALAAVALVLLVYATPAYTSAGSTVTSGGVVVSTSGHETVFAANPQARPFLIGLTCAVVAIAILGAVTAMHPSQSARRLARWALALLLVPLTAAAILALPSVGLFLLPVAVPGWILVSRTTPHPTAHRDSLPS